MVQERDFACLVLEGDAFTTDVEHLFTCLLAICLSSLAQLVKNLPAMQKPSSIPGSGRSAGEGIGYPLQYSWASLVAHLVKNLPAMQETWVRSLGQKDALEKGMATHSCILAWRIPWTVESGELYSPWGHKEVDRTE